MTKYITCAFINSDPPLKPISKKLVGLLTTLETNIQNTINLYGVWDIAYPHPDAKEDALLRVYELIIILSVSNIDPAYPSLYLFHMAQQNLCTFIIPKELLKS